MSSQRPAPGADRNRIARLSNISPSLNHNVQHTQLHSCHAWNNAFLITLYARKRLSVGGNPFLSECMRCASRRPPSARADLPLAPLRA